MLVHLQGLVYCQAAGPAADDWVVAPAFQRVPLCAAGGCLAQVESTADIVNAERLIFPGVGAFGQAMEILQQRGYTQALKEYIQVGGRRWGGGDRWRRQVATHCQAAAACTARCTAPSPAP